MSDSPKAKRSGSEKRARSPRVYARVTEAELAKIEAAAAAQGLSVGAYLRSLALARPETRPNRVALPSEILLRQLRGEAGKVDGNLAQLLKLANRREIVPVAEFAEAAKAVRNCWLHILDMLQGPA